MTDVRIHELPEAATWNGFFPQDKPGGPTECVSVATVEAKLVADGFTKNSQLASYQLKNDPLDYLQFKLTPTGVPTAAGVFSWNATDKTLDLQMPDGITLQLGQETQLIATNNTGSTIPNGAAVYVSGASGNRVTVALADADGVGTDGVVGIATQDIANAQSGKITLLGLVRDLNTDAYAEGTKLYLSTTPGQLTATPPAYPSRIWNVATVSRQHTSQGSILVYVRDLTSTNHTVASNILLKSNGSGGFSASGLTDDGTTLSVARNVNLGSGQKLSQNGVDRLTAAGGFVGTSATLAGIVIRPEYTYPTTDTAIYGKDVTANATNWSAWFSNNGDLAGLNANNVVSLAINGITKLAVGSSYVNLSAKLMISGVDRISAAGAFTGTSGTFSGGLSWGGGVLQDLPSSSAVTSLFGSAVSPRGATNWSLVAAKDGSATGINGTNNSSLSVAGNPIFVVTSSGAAVTGSVKVSGLAGSGVRLVASDSAGNFTALANGSSNYFPKYSASSAVFESSALYDNGSLLVYSGSSGIQIGPVYASKQRYSIQIRSDANFNLGDCASSIVLQTSASGTITLSGGNDGDVWWVETSGGGIVVPNGVTLWLHNTAYTGPTTWNIGGGRPTMLIRISATKWWAPNL